MSFKDEKKQKFYPAGLWGALLLIMLTGLFLFPVVNDQYVIIEDKVLIRDNSALSERGSISEFFTHSMYREGSEDAGPLYRPLVLLSFYLNRILLGHEAFTYRLVNLLLHITAVFMLYLLLAHFWGYGFRSLMPSLLFAVHPVHIDNVGFLINRSDIMALILLLCGVIVLIRNPWWKRYFSFLDKPYPEVRGSLGAAFFAGAFFFAALLAKEMSAGILAVLLVFASLRSFALKRLYIPRPLVYLGAISVVMFFAYMMIRYNAIGQIGGDPTYTLFPERDVSRIIPTVSRVFSEYIYMLILPLNLRIDYMDYSVSNGLLDPRAILSYACHIMVFAAVIWQIRKRPYISFILVSFYAALLPVSHIVPFFEIKAERLLYIPGVFFFIAISCPLAYIGYGFDKKRLMILLSAVLIIFYGSISFQYSINLSSEKLFWSEMVRRKPDNPKFQYNMGVMYWNEEQPFKAIVHFEKALESDPKYGRAYFPLAASYSAIAKKEKANQTFLKGLRIVPQSVILNKNYAVFLMFNGDLKGALHYIGMANQLSSKAKDKDIENIMKEIQNRIKGDKKRQY